MQFDDYVCDLRTVGYEVEQLTPLDHGHSRHDLIEDCWIAVGEDAMKSRRVFAIRGELLLVFTRR